MVHITLVPLQLDDEYIVRQAAFEISNALQIEVRLEEGHLDLRGFYSAEHNQYNADDFLKELTRICPHEDGKIVAVTAVDLFTPILTYIFGQAYLGGRTAIVSGYRMHNERYGLAEDQELYRSRVIKTVFHEIGHSFGLPHCLDPTCVMVASTYVEELDMKSSQYCRTCRTTLDLKLH